MSQSPDNVKSLALLHFIVLIFGFTGILGKLITIDSQPLVWYRMLIASVCLGIYLILLGKQFKMPLKGFVATILTGFVIAAHWITFFEAIKVSTVSITLAALASASMFTAFLEPLFFKRKIHWYELLLGFMVILGLYFIFQFETDNAYGILLGLISAFLASLFTVINGKLIKHYDSTRISFYELSGGVIAISLFFMVTGSPIPDFNISVENWLYIVILAVVATAFAFVASVEVMKNLTPFTVSLSINLEPVYGIILAFLFFGEEEKMSTGFYFGTLMILSAIFLNEFVKRKARRKRKRLEANAEAP